MPCHICGEPIASRGFGFAGFRHERKSNAILWVCEAHIPVGEARWEDANAGIDRNASAPSPDPRPEQGGEDAEHAGRASAGKRPAKADKPDTGQGSLF